MVTGLSINQKVEPDVILDLNARHLSDMIRSYEEERKKLTKTVIFIKKRFIWYNYSFQKRSDLLTTGYAYFDTSANTIEFYDYYNQVKDFGFKWENDYIRYEITLSTDQN